ncbi:MAG TPA: UV DNA damage repair endonuclease UvsE [Elusimicrobiota bacterium]|nr:UV DNA damage repair endonuclease UvsE [Elusimicrobiota bacterium]
MKIGYPCLNRGIGCTANSTFRLANYSASRFLTTVQNNLSCLRDILRYNIDHGLLFLRISSDIIPFASHPVCTLNWRKTFNKELAGLGKLIRAHRMRISMHPDQFVLLNAQRQNIVDKSVRDLDWHCRFLDSMGMGDDAKVQIHIGGVYGDKPSAIDRFTRTYRRLPLFIRRRLVIENDDRLFTVRDCLDIHRTTGIPVLFDNFHHACHNDGESLRTALRQTACTWKTTDGPPMLDYSSQQPGARRGKHAESIDIDDFKEFLRASRGWDGDIMLEIKDKEQSALKAVELIRKAAAGSPRIRQ